MQTITPGQARRSGYRPITTGYRLPQEQWMLDNVIADMRRGGIDHQLVDGEIGPEVWRKPGSVAAVAHRMAA
jgi:hypothetical protein